MPYHYGADSASKLITCDQRLVNVMYEVIKYIDVKVIWGWRGKDQQNGYYDTGFSQKRWPDSKHNFRRVVDSVLVPNSLAVDIAPYYPDRPHIRWNDSDGFIYLAGMVMGIAYSMGITLRNGNDWDLDNDLLDQTFYDRGHFELVED